MQARCPGKLPGPLRTWEWLPVWLRSLEPIDRAICIPAAKSVPKCCGGGGSGGGSGGGGGGLELTSVSMSVGGEVAGPDADDIAVATSRLGVSADV
jgi:hypothetical protein